MQCGITSREQPEHDLQLLLLTSQLLIVLMTRSLTDLHKCVNNIPCCVLVSW